MRLKTLGILSCCFLIVLAVALFISHQKKSSRQQTVIGQRLFENLPANDIETIEVVGPKGSILLKKGPASWVVASRYGYPADFAKISDLAKKLAGAKVGRSFEASAKVITRLGMHVPGEKGIPEKQQGTRIVFKDKDGKTLADIILGRSEDASAPGNTFYVRHTQESTVYLIDKSFKFLDTKVTEWIEKTLIDLDAKAIAQVTCLNPRTQRQIYSVKRPAPEKAPVFVDLPPGKKIVKYKLDQIIEVLDSFSIDDVVDPKANLPPAAFAKGLVYEYRLFDGTVYRLQPGVPLADDPEKHYLKVGVGYTPPAEKAEKNDADRAEQRKGLAAEAEKRNQRLSAWTYVISKWLYNSLIADPGEFFEKEAKK